MKIKIVKSSKRNLNLYIYIINILIIKKIFFLIDDFEILKMTILYINIFVFIFKYKNYIFLYMDDDDTI